MTGTLWILGAVVALALVAIGAFGLFFPHQLARQYGLHDEGASAPGFVRATAVRDCAFGAALLAAALLHSAPMVTVLAVVGIGLAIADFVISYHGGGKRLQPQHAIHAGGIVAFVLIAAMALFAIGR